MEINVTTQPDYESIRMENEQFMEDRNEFDFKKYQIKSLYLFKKLLFL